MKKVFLLAAAACMMSAANAQDLVIPTYRTNPNVEIIQDGRYDPIGNNIGNTSTNTVICLGDVDFSENYGAASMLFAQGWGGNGNYAILSAGSSYEEAQPFAQLALAHTQSYNNYVELAGNMGYNATSASDLPGGAYAVEGMTFVKPKGVQKVYLTFVGGAGNIRSVNFYKNTFTPADFHSAGGWEPLNGQLLRPNEKDNYGEVSTRLALENSVLVSSPSPDTRIDGGNGWGWTTDGVIVDYGMMNFGAGEYTQVCTYVNHWANNPNDMVEFYIDAVEEGNKIGHVFTGMELHDNMYAKAAMLDRVVTGEHRVYVKWIGGSSNITHVDFCKGNVWPVSPDADPEAKTVDQLFDITPNAKRYTMLSGVRKATKIEEHQALNKGQLEANGNYGYTGNGTVLKLKNIDFENGQYNKLYMTYATGGGNFIGFKEDANISLYIDLEADGKTYDWGGDMQEQLAGVDPIAVVRHQATGGWDIRKTIGDDLASVAGVHDVYVVYFQRYNSDEGANIFDYYLDTVVPAKEPKITGISIKGQDVELVEGVTDYNMTLTEQFTREDVVVTTEDAEDLTLSVEVAPVVKAPALAPASTNDYVVTVSLLDDNNEPVLVYTVNVTVQISTGVNDINVVNNAVRKMLVDGQVIIVKGEKKFNVIGQPMK